MVFRNSHRARRPGKSPCRAGDRPRRWVPRLECLEDRLTPVVDTLIAGGLQFFAPDGFNQTGVNTYDVTSGIVSIGYKPAGQEPFLALLQVDVQAPPATSSPKFSLNRSAASPDFTLTNVLMKVVASGPGIPIWQPPGTGSFKFDITQLTGNGTFLNVGTSKPFEVANIDFGLNRLQLANPGGGNTSDAQVKMQGSASFENVPIVKDLNITAQVAGTNYVVASSAGIDLTGLKVQKALPTSATIAGMALSGVVSIEYTKTQNTHAFSFGGQLKLTSHKQGDSNTSGLQGVSAGLSLTISNGAVTDLGFSISTEFKAFGLSVDINNNEPLTVDYSLAQNRWEIGGFIQVNFNNSEGIVAELVDPLDNSPGIIIDNGGVIQKFDAVISTQFQFFGAEIATTPSLSFEYNHDLEQFEMSGALSLTVGDTLITATMQFPNGDPGLVIKDGKLDKLNLGLSGSFNIYDLQVIVNTASVSWQSNPQGDVLIINGDFEADFNAFSIGLKLGTQDNPNGLTIKNGTFQVGGITVIMRNADFGIFTVEELQVAWQPDGSDFDLDIDIDLTFPGGFTVGGMLDFKDGVLNDISFDYHSVEGIPVADTGLFLTDIVASVKNLETPAQLTVSGDIGLTFGETFSALGKQNVNLFRAEGDFTVDANELVLEADAYMFAYNSSTPQTPVWQGLLGKADAKLTLDWGHRLYSLHVEVDGLAIFFDLKADMTFAAGKDIRFLADADVVIPDIVPFIGGKKLGGFGFFFDHHFQSPISTTLAAWIELHIIWDIEVGFEVLYDAQGNRSISLIGAGTIDGFKKGTQQSNEPLTYTYTADLKGLIPNNASYATLHADWLKAAPGVTILGRPTFSIQHTVNGNTTTYKESEFAAHGIALIDHAAFDTLTTKAVHFVASATDQYATLEGDYKLLVNVKAEGGNPFPNFGKTGAFPDDLKIQASYHVPKPVFGSKFSNDPFIPVVPSTPRDTFPVTLQGNMDLAALTQGKGKVSLYRLLQQDLPSNFGEQLAPLIPPTAKLIGSVIPSQFTGNGINWQAEIDVPIDHLYPLPYVVYAVVDDGFNVPVVSAISQPFTPGFAVEGTVSNQLHDALTGWKVFLDYNRNGQHEVWEPITQTSNPDGYYAFTPTFALSTGWLDIPVNQPIDVRVVVPSNQYIPEQNPVAITYINSTIIADFPIRETSAIKGTVFSDEGQDGNPNDGQPLAGVRILLHSDGQGEIEPLDLTTLTNAAGQYTFGNLPAGTYTVRADVPSISGSPVTAYSVPTVMGGNHPNGPAALGMSFDVTNPIEISQLGIFDSGGDGFHGTLNAILYDRVTRKPVRALTFTQADPGLLQGGSRFKNLAEPVTLYTGFQGLIVAEGFSAKDPWGDNNPSKGPANGGANQLVFNGTGVYGPAGQYPTNVGGNKVPNPYMAGTFTFTKPARVLTSPAGGTHTVTIDNSGFDLQLGNNFSIQPLSSITGSVTGQQRTNGALNPATPVAGVTLHLLQAGIVVGSATSSNAGGYAFNDLKPGAYSVQQVVPAGYRQITPYGSPLVLANPTGANTGSLSILPTNLAIADYNGDGKPDIAVMDDNAQGAVGIQVIPHSAYPNPTYTVGSANPQDMPQGIVPVQRQGDPRPGVLMLYNFGQVDLFSSQNGVLQTGQTIAQLPKGPSFDNSYDFLVTGNFNGAVSGIQLAAMYGNGEGNAGVVVFAEGGQPQEVYTYSADPIANMVAGDINGDGFTDLFVGNFSGPAMLLYSNGTGGFQQLSMPGLGGGFVLLGDINNDNLLDLCLITGNNAFAYALQGPGGAFPQLVTTNINLGNSYPWILQDLNGDLRTDLAWIEPTTDVRGLRVALNTGNPSQWLSADLVSQWPLAAHINNSGSALPEMAAVDWDADGFNDLVLTDPINALIELVHNQTQIVPAPRQLTLQAGEHPIDQDFLNAQPPKSIDHVLSMPPKLGAGDWTIRVNGNRLEIHDRTLGLFSSQLLDDLNSLTITASNSRNSKITVDLTQAHINLPGGIHIQGTTQRSESLRLLLGDRDDVVDFESGQATLNGLPITWNNLNALAISTGNGNDSFTFRGTPVGTALLSIDGGGGNDTYGVYTKNTSFHITDRSGADTLDFSQAQRAVQVNLSRDRGQTQRIGDGNRLQIVGSVEHLIGSRFDDDLKGSSANNIILGGAGNDRIWGLDGRDLLIGGLGRDVLRGNDHDDLLIGGTTSHDQDSQALLLVLAEWSSRRDYVTRIANLVSGSGSPARLNGDIFLTLASVQNDFAADALLGGDGRDWFWAFAGDQSPGRKGNERVN